MSDKHIALLAVGVSLVLSIYASTYTFPIFVEARKSVTEIECYPQDGGKTRCCGSEVDDKLIYGYTGVTYCTTCDNTQPPSNCTPREKIEGRAEAPAGVLPKDLNTKAGVLSKNLNTKANEPANDTSNSNDLRNPMGNGITKSPG